MSCSPTALRVAFACVPCQGRDRRSAADRRHGEISTKVALVTGGSSGIGEATTGKLRELGYTTYAIAHFAVYTAPWHNANPTAMNDRNYVYLCGDDVASNPLASSCTLQTCTDTVANYSIQVMGSPDYVGTPHQVLDGTMLALDVSADFLHDAVAVAVGAIVGCGYAVDGITVRGAFAVSDASFTVGGAFAVGDVGFVVGYAFSMGGAHVAEARAP